MRFLADSAGSPGTRTAIIGSGAVGSCLAAVLAQRGLNVVAVDTDPDRVADLRAGRCRVPEPGLA
ncbi:MAG TPA: 2-dehydropantoate 2-reductase N-terminal domain-containing protein, partial [Micromonosporaceae bacterium]|nr:2-dehydropantoate 2-reductase N-terminal domain-containing protein [Micromonosporaceae bacterium]